MSKAEKVQSLSVEEVNARLPLIRRVVADLLQTWRVRETLREEIASFRRSVSPRSSPELTETIQRLSQEEEGLSAVLANYEQEVQQLGGIIADQRQGLVDFLSQLDGRVVFLCWKPGDETISFWRGLDHDADDRRPLGKDLSLSGKDTGYV